MARTILAGNWKQNLNYNEASDLTARLIDITFNCDEVVICPPTLYLEDMNERVRSYEMSLGAQDVSRYTGGAYTGEVAASMLRSVGVQYCIIGHSERREYFNESSEVLREKLVNLRDSDIIPIFCCGESLETRKAGQHIDFVLNQLQEVLTGHEDYVTEELVIAYEPIWAIGTGETASPAQAEEMHAAIRQWLVKNFTPAFAAEVPILYGGSVKPNNAVELFACPNIDGGLVGGASLDVHSFDEIGSSF
jgi:triosephosphate isomerase